ncbi:MAG: hypothetical protein ACLQGJ_10170 [Candidatus Dormibacteria bacterium]
MTPHGITPGEVARRLAGCGYPVTDRRLTDWRARGWLPKLSRARPTKGEGPRACYVWSDPEVVEQTLTLILALGLRGRMETARTLTWFSGFAYPVTEMRNDWAAFEEQPWRAERRRALAGLGGSDEDAVDALKLEARATRPLQKLGLSPLFTDTYVRLLFDVNYRPEAELGTDQAQRLLRDLPRVFKIEALDRLFPNLRPEPVPKIVEFLQELHNRPRLVSLIRGLSDVEIETIHRDIAFLLGPYRLWLHDAIARANAGEARDTAGLWMVPRLGWRIGRYLMLLDIALRRRGLGPQIDATFDRLRQVAVDPENRALVARLWQTGRPLIFSVEGDARQRQVEFGRLVASAPGHEHLQESVSDFAEDLRTIWRPAVAQLKTFFMFSPESGG